MDRGVTQRMYEVIIRRRTIEQRSRKSVYFRRKEDIGSVRPSRPALAIKSKSIALGGRLTARMVQT